VILRCKAGSDDRECIRSLKIKVTQGGEPSIARLESKLIQSAQLPETDLPVYDIPAPTYTGPTYGEWKTEVKTPVEEVTDQFRTLRKVLPVSQRNVDMCRSKVKAICPC
jgi:hypothetical protein